MPKPLEPRKSKRHPLLRDRPKNVWQEDLAPLIKGYPKSQESFDHIQALARRNVQRINAEGLTRHGIPDGWAGKRAEVVAIRAQAAIDAQRIYMELVETGIIEPEDAAMVVAEGMAKDDGSRAEHALVGLIAITIDRTQQTRDRLSAFQTILTYTKSKPVVKTAVAVASAESFLDALMAGSTVDVLEGE